MHVCMYVDWAFSEFENKSKPLDKTWHAQGFGAGTQKIDFEQALHRLMNFCCVGVWVVL